MSGVSDALAYLLGLLTTLLAVFAALIVCVIALFVKTSRIKKRLEDIETTLYDKSCAAPVIKAENETVNREEPKSETVALKSEISAPKVEVQEPKSEPPAAPKSTALRKSSALTPLINFIKGGNLWVTVGLILLVLGLTFFYLYMSRKYHIPPEFKVSGGVLLGFAIFIFAFLKRTVLPNFSLIMQGGGLGIMYLAIFAAFKIYKIIPVELAFGLLAILIAAAALMALLQNSEAMAFFSAVIGFAAPVLLSTGSNNYIALFSFYSVLNLCVLTAALRKYWRYLNGVSFFCTYTVWTAWANKYYLPENFLHILIFSTIFFIIFTLINFLSTLKTENRKVENLFAVATPFVHMGVMLYITRHFQYGQAIAAFSIGIFYFLLYTVISKARADRYRPLAYLYLPFAIIFLNFSIPLALAGEWVNAIWALEGAMLTVVGWQQKNRFFRFFGLILIFGAFGYAPDVDYFSTVFLNSAFVCRLLTAAAMLIAAGVFRLQDNWEKKFLSYIVLIIGTVLWYSWLISEAANNSNELYIRLFYLIIFSISGLIYALGGKKLNWFLPQVLAFSPVIAAVILSPKLFWVQVEDYYWAGWLIFILVQAALMYIYRDKAINKRMLITHAVSLFFAVSFLGELLNYGFDKLLNFKEGEIIFTHDILLAATFAVSIIALLRFNRRHISLFGREIHFDAGVMKDALPIWKVYGCGFIAIYMVYFLFILGGSVYQAYINGEYIITLPLLNTADGASLLMVIAILFYFAWLFKNRKPPIKLQGALKWVRGLAVFFWVNALLGRAVFYLSDGSKYSLSWLMNSAAYQFAIAVFWGLAGFAFIAYGFKKFRKTYWTIGVVLLVVDTLKLFLIDLSSVDTLQRILSFLGVGLIFIAIGYFFPLPRKLTEQDGKEG